MSGFKHNQKEPGQRRPVAGILSLTLVSLAFAVSFHCTELSVPPVVEKGFLVPPSSDALPVSVEITGESIDDKEWIRSYTVYRIVFDDLLNTTGSLLTLLEPGVLQALHQNELRLLDPSQLLPENQHIYERVPAAETEGEACHLRLHFDQTNISWYPRREFVQTASGIRPGHIVTLFEYEACLKPAVPSSGEIRDKGETANGESARSDSGGAGHTCRQFRIERTTRSHSPEAQDTLETEANLVLKQIQADITGFIRENRSLCIPAD